MGDIIEITTWPKHQNIYYPVKSNAIAFDVRGASCAGIGLAKKPRGKCDYWICIGDRGTSWIKGDIGCSKAESTQDILGSNQLKRFWITWHSGNIYLGKHGEAKPFITHPNNIPDLGFVTFTNSLGRGNTAIFWKFEMPPLMESKIKPITQGALHWADVETQLPNNAVIGGYDKEILYVIRASHRAALTPGKFVPSEGVAYVAWGGDANEVHQFQVLCGFDCVWQPTSEDKIPVHAFGGGYTEQQEELFVGRAEHKGFLIPGKVQPSHKVCYIPFEGKEIAKKHYEILVEPCSNKKGVNSISSGSTDSSASESESQHDDNSEDAMHDDVF